jgi:PPE-repeat protein
MRGYAHEFMEMNIDVDPDWSGSDSGSAATSDRAAGPVGFAGAVAKSGLAATGLATLDDDDFGGGPVMPMVPATWNAGPSGEAGQGGEHD